MIRALAESENYKIISEYEVVSLIKKHDGTEVCIGDFYGDPGGAIIDFSERFVVMYGCGLIIYYIKKPFKPYCYNTKSKQWTEYGRNDPVIWIEKVSQIDDNTIEIVMESGEKEYIKIKRKMLW